MRLHLDPFVPMMGRFPALTGYAAAEERPEFGVDLDRRAVVRRATGEVALELADRPQWLGADTFHGAVLLCRLANGAPDRSERVRFLDGDAANLAVDNLAWDTRGGEWMLRFPTPRSIIRWPNETHFTQWANLGPLFHGGVSYNANLSSHGRIFINYARRGGRAVAVHWRPSPWPSPWSLRLGAASVRVPAASIAYYVRGGEAIGRGCGRHVTPVRGDYANLSDPIEAVFTSACAIDSKRKRMRREIRRL